MRFSSCFSCSWNTFPEQHKEDNKIETAQSAMALSEYDNCANSDIFFGLMHMKRRKA